MKQKKLDVLLKDICNSMQTIFGSKMQAVILYGSYARGDYDAESDIDIAVLVDSDREGLTQYHHAIVKQMSRFMMDYDRLVSVTDIPASDFNAYRNILPFYRNIDTEGVRLITFTGNDMANIMKNMCLF